MLAVDAILFDFDGTLIDSKRDIALSVHHLQQTYNRPLSPDDQIARFIGDGVGKLVERAIGQRPAPELEEAVTLFKAYYREHALDNTRLYPGVAETLQHFRDKKMAVVTNKPVRVSQLMIQKLGLGTYFPVVLGGDSVARKKPDPESLFLALQKLGVPPSDRVIIVGDGPQDVLAGRAAGIKTCGIPSDIGDAAALKNSKPDFILEAFADLVRIIA
jgi:phosphoglycolate phosphatase